MLNYGPAVLILFSVFVGILFNRRDFNALKKEFKDDLLAQRVDQKDDLDRRFGEVNRQFDEVNRRLTLIEQDQKQFFAVTGRMDGRIDELSRK